MTHNQRTFRPGEAHKLEAPERLLWLPVDRVLDSLDLRPGLTAADVGAGTGYFSLSLAQRIHPGAVFAVDLQIEMLALLRKKLDQRREISNVVLVQGTANHTGLASRSCNIVLLANLWHELDGHSAILDEAGRILRPGGRIAILDWRPDVEQPPGPRVEHRIAAVEVERLLNRQHWTNVRTTLTGSFSYLVVATVSR